MSKAILILNEMPSCCNNCPCFNGVEDRSDCNLLEKEIEDILIIDKDCPLKPIPHNDFIDEAESYQTEEEYKAYVSGWNECLDEILRGEK